MVYAVQADLAFSTAKIRDQVLANIRQKVNASSTWDGVVLAAEAGSVGPHGIRADVRFMQRTAQADLLTSVNSFAVGARAPLKGSSVESHDCGHDEGKPCTNVTRKVW